jgi:putative molybdopterin biosynthesis protein
VTLELLTIAEAAEYLRLKERKLYEMVAEGAIPCTKVGRWLFPKADLDQWLASTLQHPPGMPRVEPPPIVGASHDPLLEWALRESGSKLATLPAGNEAGFARFTAGEVIAAAIHLHALDDPHADANLAAMQARGDVQDAVMIGFCRRREQGFLVGPGNPLKIAGIADVMAKKAKLTQRPKGTGAQLLLLSMLRQARLAPDALPSGPMCPMGPDIAQAIRALATRSVANAAGLDFADPVGAIRPGDAAARLFPPAAAGPHALPALRCVPHARRRARRVRCLRRGRRPVCELSLRALEARP